MKDPIYQSEIQDFTGQVIAASATLENTTNPFKFGPKFENDNNPKGANVGRNGEMSLWLKLSGSGTLKAEAKVSGNRGADYVLITPEVKTGMVAGSYLVAFAIPICTNLTILLTETGGANSVTVDEAFLISR